ncbi:RNA-binding protein [Lentzea flava]|uniref:RNA-binding protein n=1 Tax=Lentzea flava TaxID=103732 RepID=A0ABQ2VDR1_9PSEU|nr:RNA-binding protein [Lentzea flava]MCP2204870.1 hypothetical protein [Lentzea flava]GGU81784.1 hypothetical protein GCM10010178_85550 [Lentzea flava]
MLTYVYEVTKYNPLHRDERGHYHGPEDVRSDHGPVEAAYLAAMAAFAENAGVTELTIRDPAVAGYINFGVEPTIPGHGLDSLFPRDLTGYHDGARVPIGTAQALVRAMLRDNGAWCRLECDDRFYVEIGYDQYMDIGTDMPCDEAVARTRELGLFPRRYEWEPDPEDDEPAPRPADEGFWTELTALVTERGSVILEEVGVRNASRWHRLRPEDVSGIRRRLTPRAGLVVWPELDDDVQSVLRDIRDNERTVTLVWEDGDGVITELCADEDLYDDLYLHLAQARGALSIPWLADEYNPLLVAVLPDDDGVVRSRWRV